MYRRWTTLKEFVDVFYLGVWLNIVGTIPNSSLKQINTQIWHCHNLVSTERHSHFIIQKGLILQAIISLKRILRPFLLAAWHRLDIMFGMKPNTHYYTPQFCGFGSFARLLVSTDKYYYYCHGWLFHFNFPCSSVLHLITTNRSSISTFELSTFSVWNSCK